MSFFMGKKFVGFGGKGSQKGPEVVFDSGEDGNRKMKRMLRPIKFGILVVFVAIAPWIPSIPCLRTRWRCSPPLAGPPAL